MLHLNKSSWLHKQNISLNCLNKNDNMNEFNFEIQKCPRNKNSSNECSNSIHCYYITLLSYYLLCLAYCLLLLSYKYTFTLPIS
jgi:hypothetical protein